MWSRNIVHDIYISINFRLAADCYLENLVDHILERTRQIEKQRKRDSGGRGRATGKERSQQGNLINVALTQQEKETRICTTNGRDEPSEIILIVSVT